MVERCVNFKENLVQYILIPSLQCKKNYPITKNKSAIKLSQCKNPFKTKISSQVTITAISQILSHWYKLFCKKINISFRAVPEKKIMGSLMALLFYTKHGSSLALMFQMFLSYRIALCIDQNILIKSSEFFQREVIITEPSLILTLLFSNFRPPGLFLTKIAQYIFGHLAFFKKVAQ